MMQRRWLDVVTSRIFDDFVINGAIHEGALQILSVESEMILWEFFNVPHSDYLLVQGFGC